MHLIMLSGGSGQRLWPLSGDVKAKQFLKLLKNEHGESESMVQRVYRQLQMVGNWDSISVVAGEQQEKELQEQLHDSVQFILEPERRDTLPAILLSCAALSSSGILDEEVIAVMPVDPFVDEDYFRCIQFAETVLKEQQVELVLLGAVPVKPSEKYGYIIPTEQKSDYKKYATFSVNCFKEKPSLVQAQELMEQGALWNCGVFVLKLHYIKEIAKELYDITDFSYENIYQNFSQFERISFDYAVVEKAKNIKVVKYEGEWKDLGTWETLTEEISQKVSGKAVLDDLCQNVCIVNETDIPVIAMDMQDVVIAVSKKGILVTNKGQSYRLKEMIQKLNDL